jgi:hypothetical protein
LVVMSKSPSYITNPFNCVLMISKTNKDAGVESIQKPPIINGIK